MELGCVDAADPGSGSVAFIADTTHGPVLGFDGGTEGQRSERQP